MHKKSDIINPDYSLALPTAISEEIIKRPPVKKPLVNAKKPVFSKINASLPITGVSGLVTINMKLIKNKVRKSTPTFITVGVIRDL